MGAYKSQIEAEVVTTSVGPSEAVVGNKSFAGGVMVFGVSAMFDVGARCRVPHRCRCPQ